MVNRFDELQENYSGCDYIGDFFESPLIKRAYGELWNEVYEEDSVQIKAKDFDIFKKEHLSFIREVFENQELSERFLLILRVNSLKLKDKDRFMYDNKQILSFLIIWQDIQDRVMNYSETLPEIFKEKIINIVSSVGGDTIYTDPKNENNYLSFTEGIGNLLKADFPCIDTEGNLIFGFPTIPQVFDFFDVVDMSGNTYSINRKGEKISEEETLEIAKNGLKDLKDFLEKIKKFLETKTPLSKAPEEMISTLAIIIQTELTGEETEEEAREIVLQYFVTQIYEAQKELNDREKVFRKAKLTVVTS